MVSNVNMDVVNLILPNGQVQTSDAITLAA